MIYALLMSAAVAAAPAPAMSQECELRLIDRQTHDIWTDFLGYIQDDATPLLPEPKPTR